MKIGNKKCTGIYNIGDIFTTIINIILFQVTSALKGQSLPTSIHAITAPTTSTREPRTMQPV